MNTHSLIDDPTRASRYLAGQLSDAESAAYEARFAEDPDALAELEATARLKIGLHRLRRDGELSELLASTSSPSPNRTWMLAMAAGIAAAVIGIGLWFPRTAPISAPVLASAASVFKDHNGHSLSVMATAPLFRTRAEKYDAVIELPRERGAIKLRVLPSSPTPAARYQAALSRMKDDDTAERAVTVTDLKPSADDGFIDVFADSSLLAPGRYRLTLTRAPGGTDTGESDTFVIKVNSTH
ncbi:MAG: hypothetical protein JSR66_01005 [Proteobacteria bacterium]|nr:hypothetical protein [Pseudomonadota bacterium]